MDRKPLTGLAAAEALGVYVRLGESGAAFDATRVARAVRTAVGRRRVTAALVVAVRAAIPNVGRRRRRVLRSVLARPAVLAAADPGRPRLAPEGASDGA